MTEEEAILLENNIEIFEVNYGWRVFYFIRKRYGSIGIEYLVDNQTFVSSIIIDMFSDKYTKLEFYKREDAINAALKYLKIKTMNKACE